MSSTVTIVSSVDGPGRSRQPTNRRDRERFAGLSDAQRNAVATQAAHLYDGSRTLARCWTEALDAATQPDAAKACVRCQAEVATSCRICRASLCRNCFTDHHYEGYGVPADSH